MGCVCPICLNDRSARERIAKCQLPQSSHSGTLRARPQGSPRPPSVVTKRAQATRSHYDERTNRTMASPLWPTSRSSCTSSGMAFFSRSASSAAAAPSSASSLPSSTSSSS
eukprot:15515-Eustigmatos_ZCMA.PRE.1